MKGNGIEKLLNAQKRVREELRRETPNEEDLMMKMTSQQKMKLQK